ncbi:MAG: hypothetical protein R2909_18545 [Gemmatimonadales bacterium]
MQAGLELAGDRRHLELFVLGEHDQQTPRLDQRAAAVDDQLEDAGDLGLAADRAGDVGHNRERLGGALGLVALAFGLVAAAAHTFVEARVLNRDRRPVGEHRDRRLVALVELRAAGLLGQVEVSPDVAANPDRHAEEGAHRRVPRGESVGSGVGGHVGEAKRLGVPDQLAQYAVPSRQVADLGAGGVVDTERKEAFQLATALVEDAERRVARPGQLARCVEHEFEHALEIEAGDQRPADLDQPARSRRIDRG